MTPEQIEFHRKRFEESCGFHLTPAQKEYGDRGVYAQPWANDMLKGYLMAIESIDIELPNYLSLNEDMEEKDIITRVVHNDCVNEFKFIINAAGLKVKES